MFDKIIDYLNSHIYIKLAIDAYLVFIVVFVLLRFFLRNKKALSILITSLFLFLISFIAIKFTLEVSSKIFEILLEVYIIGILIVLAPEIRKSLDSIGKDTKHELVSSSNHTKLQIADSVMFLASRQIGALITIEKHNSLDQYAEKAIQLDSAVSKELLINIFTPNTPLHDGAVIVRGNKIRCAGAYYVLTHQDDLDKTTGSRHRAGLGISEVTDALTIIVSEETGNISIAVEGIMFKIQEKQKLLEYLDMFLK